MPFAKDDEEIGTQDSHPPETSGAGEVELRLGRVRLNTGHREKEVLLALMASPLVQVDVV